MTEPLTTPATPTRSTRYEAVIGVEVHCQLKTISKMFCSCSTVYDGAARDADGNGSTRPDDGQDDARHEHDSDDRLQGNPLL